MSDAKNLLVELFVEELPPKALKKLGESFGASLLQGLRSAGLASEGSALTVFASPRRLGAHISHVLPVAPETAQAIKLMPVAVGLAADGSATPALLKKLAAVGASAHAVPLLYQAPDGKSTALFLDMKVPGATLDTGLQAALAEALAKLPIPKVMQYQLHTGGGEHFQPGWTSVNFVRPAHGLVALHGADVVPVTALGLDAGRATHGHRFEAAVDPVVIQHADDYERQLAEQGAVIASFAARRAEIVRQLTAAAGALGLKPIDDDALLDEVTALVERPKVMTCAFEAEFLAVPPECLILTMKANQKYFPLLDDAGQLTRHFLIVSNIDPVDPSRVIQGNERVVRPRLADAKFFFDQDRKEKLDRRVAGLDKVVYHGKLGTQGERVKRVRAIAKQIVAMLVGRENLASFVDRAAYLAKADLLTDMVGEFPELQGIMGRYYALHEGEQEDVAFAIEDHYKPRFAGDSLPRSYLGLVLALADKLETLTGLFGIGQMPSGDKDPFALRRHALGVVRMLVERDLPLKVQALVNVAFSVFPTGLLLQSQDAVSSFLFDRLNSYLREKGFSPPQVDAVLAARPPIHELKQRLAAVRTFCSLPEAPALASANKRVSNILKKVEGEVPEVFKASLLQEPAERALAGALQGIEIHAASLFEVGDFAGSLQALAALKAPVDGFFDDVMVNVEDIALRNNRLALLVRLRNAMNHVADLSRLAT